MTELTGRRLALALSAGAVFASSAASAQDIPRTVEPGAIEQEFRAAPDRYSDAPVSVPSASGPVAPAGAENQRLQLTSLSVEGVAVFTPEQIRALYAGMVGTEISLADLFGVAQAITKLYADAGYPLSVAFLPAQEIAGGAARIVVYEGYVAEVEVTGDVGSAKSAVEGVARMLIGERPLSARTLERYVLLVNDIPGVSAQAVIDRSSGGPGAVKVIFAVERKRTDLVAGVNNRGSRALGPGRVQLSGALNGVALSGDRLRADLVQSTNFDELTFVSAGYDLPIGTEGFRLGAWVSASDAEPGVALLQALAYASEGWTAGLEATHPLVRSRAFNVMFRGSFEYNELESSFDDVLNSRDVLWVGRAGVQLDSVGAAGGYNTAGVLFSQGFAMGAATLAGDPLASRDRGSAKFFSVALDAGRVQPLSQGWEVALAGHAQFSGRKLLASEECGYGGGGVGRGFDNFEVSGDHCVTVSAELRAPTEQLFGTLSGAPYGFWDHGQVWNHGAEAPGALEHDEAQSIGGGVRLALGESVSAYVEYAKPIDHDVALEGDRKGRLFFGLTARR
jgi:hemolysin activation/secretion protein